MPALTYNSGPSQVISEGLLKEHGTVFFPVFQPLLGEDFTLFALCISHGQQAAQAQRPVAPSMGVQAETTVPEQM